LDWPITPISGQISLALWKTKAPRTGKLKGTTVQCGERSAKADLEIMDIDPHTSVLMGVDLFRVFGFSIERLPMDYPGVTKEQDNARPDLAHESPDILVRRAH
jgi:hypothetical protein